MSQAEATRFIQIFYMGGEAEHLGQLALLFLGHQQGASCMGVEQLGHKPVLLWNPGIAGGSFILYATMPASAATLSTIDT